MNIFLILPDFLDKFTHARTFKDKLLFHTRGRPRSELGHYCLFGIKVPLVLAMLYRLLKTYKISPHIAKDVLVVPA